MKHCILTLSDSILDSVKKITDAGHQGGEQGIAVVLDNNKKLLGVVTDGDIRKAISNKIDLSSPVSKIMNLNPICVKKNNNVDQILKDSLSQLRKKEVHVHRIIVVDDQNIFHDIINLYDLYQSSDVTQKRVAVYGMGYVGLTLALTLAEEKMFDVIGIDTNVNIVNNLNDGIPSFFENGLVPLLKRQIEEKNILFTHNYKTAAADIHIISVGTPVNRNRSPDTSYLQNVGEQIGELLKKGDIIICRSTVPVGTTRGFLIPILENKSGMKAGIDFHIAFAPERTVEGMALKELRSLPQVVGGLTAKCTDLTEKLFKKFAPTTIRVKSLEEAEFVKLINNTFRDLVFSFANEISFLCDPFNINAFELIEAANEGYPRNPIPFPSPGVGGICLSKDPYLYSTSTQQSDVFVESKLGLISREINERGSHYVAWQFKKFMKQKGISNYSDKKVLVAGLAFKGLPETSDVRSSPGLDLAMHLKEMGFIVLGYDAVVSLNDINKLGLKAIELKEGFRDASAVFFMNNHHNHVKFDFFEALKSMKKPAYFFDGWNQFNGDEITSIEDVSYSTLGFNSSRIL